MQQFVTKEIHVSKIKDNRDPTSWYATKCPWDMVFALDIYENAAHLRS